MLAGRDALAAKGGESAGSDARILNTALGAELEAIAAYQVGAESGLLQKPVLDLAVTFQGHHKEHADLLAKTIAKLGGKPVSAKAKYTFPTETLKTQNDVLRFAATLEKGAVSAYLGAVPRVRQPRPRQGRREHPRRRGDALGDPAQRARRGAGAFRLRVLSLVRPVRMLAGVALAVAAGAASIDAAARGRPERGEAIYERCLACHALAYDRTGPRHCGLFGRRAGSVQGFAYSDAMKRSKIVWNEQTLDRFLANPLAAVPGTSMGYAGVTDVKERADLIAYLKQAGDSPLCRN